MRIPGDKRSEGDKPMVVRCKCGGVLTVLAPGESVVGAGTDSARSREVTCDRCGGNQVVRVAAASAS